MIVKWLHRVKMKDFVMESNKMFRNHSSMYGRVFTLRSFWRRAIPCIHRGVSKGLFMKGRLYPLRRVLVNFLSSRAISRLIWCFSSRLDFVSLLVSSRRMRLLYRDPVLSSRGRW